MNRSSQALPSDSKEKSAGTNLFQANTLDKSVPRNTVIREKLRQLFVTDADFDAFCLDCYKSVYDSFTDGMQRKRKETLLLSFASLHLPTLAKALRIFDSQWVNEHEELFEPEIQFLGEEIKEQVGSFFKTNGPPDETLTNGHFSIIRYIYTKVRSSLALVGIKTVCEWIRSLIDFDDKRNAQAREP